MTGAAGTRRATPRISAVVQSWQAAHYIAAAVESILRQTISDIELIVVDGGSTDGTPAIVEEYARSDDRVRLVALPDPTPRGSCANLGISMARAPLVARMDADDVAVPERFERQLAWMTAWQLDVCGTHADEFGAREGRLTFPESHDGIVHEQLFRLGIFNPTVVARTRALREYPYGDTPFEDYELWMRLLPVCRFGNLPEPMLRHRAHDRQWHVRRPDELLQDSARYRFGHFYRLFPDAPLREYLPVSRMADRRAMTSLDELSRAGAWLVRLSSPPDYWLRSAMLHRWRRTCDLSEELGDDVTAIRAEVEARLLAFVDDVSPAACRP